ncbi:MAG: UDP-N-acetylmuramate--L-alanine ligase [Puniceicoccaceae bacterium]
MWGLCERKELYLIGIGGTAMGNLAVAMSRAGWRVGGSDAGVYPPVSGLLEEAGIGVDSPAEVGGLASWKGGVFVVGNAVSRGHPQVEWLMENPGERRLSFPEFMGDFLLRRCRNLVVAGTHGKSTTSAVAARLLADAGEPAGWFVGGVMADGTPALSGDGSERYFVIEGDEYDSAFFDKRSKFVHYRPQVLLLNNLEFDHADIFRDEEDVRRSFRQVIALVPPGGLILYNGDDPRLASMLPVRWTRCSSFGTGAANDFRVGHRAGSGRTTIRIQPRRGGGAEPLTVESPLIGSFNVRNVAGAALAVRELCPALADRRGFDLTGFAGLRRRQEVLFRSARRILVEDFAHHPTAIAEALGALREAFPGWRLHAMVEPRSNTMRTNRFQDRLAAALTLADSATLAPVHRREAIPAADRLDPERVAESLRSRGGRFRICAEEDDLAEAFREGLGPEPVLTVVFSNGAFGGKVPGFLDILRSGA